MLLLLVAFVGLVVELRAGVDVMIADAVEELPLADGVAAKRTGSTRKDVTS
jgi:hypothetical protein